MTNTLIAYLACALTLLAPTRPASAQVGVPSDQLAPPSTGVPATSGTVRVRVESGQNLTLHHADGERICQAPCEFTVRPGDNDFLLSLGDLAAQRASTVSITGPGVLRARYIDHSGLRASGWALFVIAAAATVGGSVAGALMVSSGDPIGAGAGIGVLMLAGLHLLLATLAGLPMALAGNGASVEFD